MALSQGFSQRVVGEQQAITLFGGGSGWVAKQGLKRQENWFSYTC